MNRPTFRRRALAAAAALSCLAPALVWSQDKYPSRPVTFIVPFAAGSATDQLARALGASFTEQTRQTVVVENRAGASGIIAAQAAAKAPADGYTVLITTNTTQAANPHLYKKLPYDPAKDFAPITGLGRGGMVLVVRPESPYRSVKDLVEAAQKRPGRMTFGAGNSSSRVAGEMFKQLTSTDFLYVPYKSNPGALTDLLGGQIDMMIIDTVTGLPQIESGRLKPLATSTAKRLPQLPSVPTLQETGVKGYELGYWYAAYVPAKTPPQVVARLNAVLVNAVNSAQAKSFFQSVGNDPWTTKPDELARYQAAEAGKWGKVIQAANIEPE
jgi:tripartite-type tricarboxylate transporter receptor subunit TctC